MILVGLGESGLYSDILSRPKGGGAHRGMFFRVFVTRVYFEKLKS